jgi:hypothetical protein
MSSIVTSNSRRAGHDHFEPEAILDPHEQRRLRGYLELIDYAAFAANREVLSQEVGRVDIGAFQRLAVAAAHARAQWVAMAVSLTEKAHSLSPEQVAQMRALRASYDELTEVYEAMRRMVERGYLGFSAK